MPYLRRRTEENLMVSKTFIKVTNQDVYNKLISIDHKLDKINGVVGWHSKAIAGIIVVLGILIGALVS